MSLLIKRGITLFVFALVIRTIFKVPAPAPSIPTLIISGIILIVLAFVLSQLCFWSELYDKEKFKEIELKLKMEGL